ncbi:BglG family transcription antiterminator [Paenibacillus sp. FJAT-27812]|uniref:BglG family transcription antiterminator n=1 Tax=Paenibacillus sp. FJAT-27812 TaxID=1684143 RepID=UPI0006A7EAEA|nr:PRD domain-containing protein [Paenibacillus sp. FJAT-27812]
MITSRQQRILKQLMEADDYLALQQLIDEYGISDRTVRHDLLQLEDWLRDHHVVLERHRTKGVRLNHEPEQLQMLKDKIRQRPVFMDAKQRITLLLKLLLQENQITMNTIMEDYSISKSTLLVDLQEIKEWLMQRKIEFVKQKGSLSVAGSEQSKRSAYLELLRAEITEDKLLRYMFDRKEMQEQPVSALNIWFKVDDVKVIFDAIQKLEQAMNIQFADAGYITVTLHILMAMERIKHHHSIDIDQKLLQELEGTDVFRLVEKHVIPLIEQHFQVELPHSEIGYITQHMLGAQKQQLSTKDTVFVKLAKEIIERTEKESGYRLQLAEQVIQGLSIHLKPAVYRAKFNLQSKNPLLGQLQQQYGSLMKILERVVNEVMSSISIAFDQNEIGYIMLHVASGIAPHLTHSNKRVIIVCGSGIGTSAIIKRRLSYIFPQLEVVRTCSYKDSVLLTPSETDAVLSTIDIGHAIAVPWLKVSPLLAAKDQQTIANFFGITYRAETVTAMAIQSVNDIMSIVERNAVVTNRNKLLEELLLLLQGGGIREDSANVAPLLTELLPKASIHLQLDTTSWETAVRFGSRLLMARGASGLPYEQKLIDMIHLNKHSFLIQQGIYFPHAYMPEDVSQTAFSLVTFKEPILFGPSEHPVWLMITLAAVDKEKHITALSTLLDLLNDTSFISYLKTAGDSSDLWERLQNEEAQ